MDDLLALLAEGNVEAFNEQRPKRGKLELYAADLSGVQAAGGLDLTSATLEKADLTGADLTDAMLARSDLSGADISSAKLSGIMALQSRWREAFIEETDFSDADLSGADFSDAEVSDCDLSNVVLTSAKLKRTVLKRCKLDHAEMAEARMAEAKLEDCDLTEANLTEARFNDAVLAGCNFTGADLSRARLGGADLSGANLSGAKLIEADLSRAKLAGVNFEGADLGRADLSEVDLEGVDLSGARLTDAQLPPSHLHLAVGVAPPMKVMMMEEPQVAASGKLVATLWENAEAPPGRSWLRVLFGTMGTDAPEDAAALPIPADLVVARTLAATPDGFVVMLLLERPGGTAALVVPVDKAGRIGTPRRLKLGYTPAARPVLRYEDGALVLYGIAREGPGILAHRVDEAELVTLHGEGMRTVRGFVSDHHPVVLSKGGTLVSMSSSGVGAPISAPADFPGRRYAAAPSQGGLALAWCPAEKTGLRTAVVGTRGGDSDHHLLKKMPIGVVDAASFKDVAWAVFTREPTTPEGAASAWAVKLPDGEPFPVVDEEGRDVSEIRMVMGTDTPLVAIIDLDGTLEIFALKEGKAESRWRAG